MTRLLSSLLICLFLVGQVYATDLICLSEEQIKQVIIELQQKRTLEQLNENLMEYNRLLQKQNELLKEQIETYLKEHRNGK